MASVTSRAAPWLETTFPFRSRDAAITGAHVGELRMASWALTPLTPE